MVLPQSQRNHRRQTLDLGGEASRPAVTQPKPDDPAIPLIKTWNDVKLVFFDFLNER